MKQGISTFTKNIFHSGYKIILDLVMPPFCAYCRNFLTNREVFCKVCFKLICPIVSTNIVVTQTKKLKVFSIAAYKNPLKTLILAKGRSDIVAARQLGELIWSMTYIKNIDVDFIVPVPLHWSRFARRGFNQAQEMAKIISCKSGNPVVPLLARVRRTKYQAELSQDFRVSNVKNAFKLQKVDMDIYRGKNLLLIDDLMTTGSTLRFAACELYKLKPASITAVVACRVI